MQSPNLLERTASSSGAPVIQLSYSPTPAPIDGSTLISIDPLTVPTEPPSYSTVHALTVPVTYSFTPLGANTMVLAPPSELNTRAIYHVTTSMNCITGLIQTTLREGDNKAGKLVGVYEFGGPNTPKSENKVGLRKKDFKLGDLLTKVSKGYRWNMVSKGLYWLEEPLTMRSSYRCVSQLKQGTMYAQYIPAEGLWASTDSGTISQLRVHPEGQDLLDDIVLSCLIIERKRLTYNNMGSF